MKKIHYSGGIVYDSGNRLPGWPCCCFGDRAIAIKRAGNMTNNPDDVTCKLCNTLIYKQSKYKRKYFRHWWEMHKKGYCL